jgi:hypothetical protein
MPVPIMETAASTGSEMNGTALHPEGLSVYQGVRDFAVGRLDDPAERRPRHAHRLGGLLLVVALEVREPDRLELIERHDDLFELVHGDADRLEDRNGRPAGHPARAKGSWHLFISIPIMVICS